MEKVESQRNLLLADRTNQGSSLGGTPPTSVQNFLIWQIAQRQLVTHSSLQSTDYAILS